jgi:hypothetical protein
MEARTRIAESIFFITNDVFDGFLLIDLNHCIKVDIPKIFFIDFDQVLGV